MRGAGTVLLESVLNEGWLCLGHRGLQEQAEAEWLLLEEWEMGATPNEAT